MESQVHVLELESNLEKERKKLSELRKTHYKLAGESEGWEQEVSQDIYHKSFVKLRDLAVHSFIHSGYLYSAFSKNLLRGALSPATAKEKCLEKLAERTHIVPGRRRN